MKSYDNFLRGIDGFMVLYVVLGARKPPLTCIFTLWKRAAFTFCSTSSFVLLIGVI